MPDMISVTVAGKNLQVARGTTVAAAVLASGETVFRHSVSGEPRGPVCGMGICFECRLTVNGVPHVRSCQTLCEPSMEISADD